MPQKQLDANEIVIDDRKESRFSIFQTRFAQWMVICYSKYILFLLYPCIQAGGTATNAIR